MASVNKVIIVGNLGRDPEIRYAASGVAVCNLSIATSRKWKDKASGDMLEETEWHRVSLFDRMAENAGEYLRKGSSVYIEGRLKTRKYEKDGVDHYVTEIMADQMQFMGGREEGGDRGGSRDDGRGSRGRDDDRGNERNSRGREPENSRRPAPQRQAQPKSNTGFDDMDDDIQF